MDHNELLGIKSLAVMNKEQLGERLKKYFKLSWVFNNWYEKVILFILLHMGVWKIWELIFK